MNKLLKKIISGMAIVSLLLPITNAFAYTPRTTLSADDCNTQYWAYSATGNVFSRNWALSGGNCTWYAYGRAWELLGKRPALSVNGAHRWYGYNDGYERGAEPKLGAVGCWSDDASTVGHVAIVEAIDGDNITFSESGWSYTNDYFKTVTRNKYNMNYSVGGIERKFQGYIYLPIVETEIVDEQPLVVAEAPITAPVVDIKDLYVTGKLIPVTKPDINIYINGKYMPFSERAVNDNGTTLVPARDLIEAFCGIVGWDNDTKTLTANIADSVLNVGLDSNIFYINNTKIEADKPLTMNEKGQTMIPLRVVLNMIGAKISISDNYKNIYTEY